MDLTDREVEQSHVIDDLSTVLSAHRRAVKDARSMLTDALHALRNGSPEVADEFIDRTLTSFAALPWIDPR